VPALPFDPIAEARRQWVQHEWGEPDVMAAITSIVRAQQLLSAMVDAALRPLDLTFARYEALVLLYFSREGTLPLGKMSERLQVHPTSITSIVDRLEKQGLARRIRQDTDRRMVLAEILPAGRALVDKATDLVVTNAFSKVGWSKGDLQTLFKLLAQLRHNAGDFD
jgi:DNA-binding MarR family transcriptional regulator